MASWSCTDIVQHNRAPTVQALYKHSTDAVQTAQTLYRHCADAAQTMSRHWADITQKFLQSLSDAVQSDAAQTDKVQTLFRHCAIIEQTGADTVQCSNMAS